MASPLSHEEFFTSLTSLLDKTTQQTHGSVYLTQKPLLHDTPTPSESTSPRPPILIRTTDGRTDSKQPEKSKKGKDGSRAQATKVKLSTVVEQADLKAFYARYAEVCKAGMTGLKKRDRKRGKAKKGGGAGGKVTKG